MEIPRHWRLKAERYRLEGSTCPVCGQPVFPPRRQCPACAVRPAQPSDLGLIAPTQIVQIGRDHSLILTAPTGD